jgi:hypothetical protein
MRWKLRVLNRPMLIERNHPRIICLKQEEEKFKRNSSRMEEKERLIDMFILANQNIFLQESLP